MPPRETEFDFQRDTLAFPNELVWEYCFDPTSRAPRFQRSVPTRTYVHRCFILARMVHLFHRHAEFRPDLPAPDPSDLQDRVRVILGRDPRAPRASENRILIGGWPGLRALSEARGETLKHLGGGAWRSYFQRSHWRMVLPISRRHQRHTARALAQKLNGSNTAVVHVIRFPQLTINHALVLFAHLPAPHGWTFLAYDPNDVTRPTELRFDARTDSFVLDANQYWSGGTLNVIEIYCCWYL